MRYIPRLLGRQPVNAPLVCRPCIKFDVGCALITACNRPLTIQCRGTRPSFLYVGRFEWNSRRQSRAKPRCCYHPSHNSPNHLSCMAGRVVVVDDQSDKITYLPAGNWRTDYNTRTGWEFYGPPFGGSMHTTTTSGSFSSSFAGTDAHLISTRA